MRRSSRGRRKGRGVARGGSRRPARLPERPARRPARRKRVAPPPRRSSMWRRASSNRLRRRAQTERRIQPACAEPPLCRLRGLRASFSCLRASSRCPSRRLDRCGPASGKRHGDRRDARAAIGEVAEGMSPGRAGSGGAASLSSRSLCWSGWAPAGWSEVGGSWRPSSCTEARRIQHLRERRDVGVREHSARPSPPPSSRSAPPAYPTAQSPSHTSSKRWRFGVPPRLVRAVPWNPPHTRGRGRLLDRPVRRALTLICDPDPRSSRAPSDAPRE